MADQIEVLFWTAQAIVGLSLIVSGLLIGTTIYFQVRDETLPKRRARKQRDAIREAAYAERQAARVYQLPTSNVKPINGSRPAA